MHFYIIDLFDKVSFGTPFSKMTAGCVIDNSGHLCAIPMVVKGLNFDIKIIDLSVLALRDIWWELYELIADRERKLLQVYSQYKHDVFKF